MCRKYSTLGLTAPVPLESLLRVQEIQARLSLDWNVSRITPACAGNTIYSKIFKSAFKNHSCVCRKYYLIEVPNSDVDESLLRVQEIHNSSFKTFIVGRITPACAGNTLKGFQTWICVWNHSCVCRKYMVRVSQLVNGRESLLRVQEIQLKSMSKQANKRITPACAGNTRSEII